MKHAAPFFPTAAKGAPFSLHHCKNGGSQHVNLNTNIETMLERIWASATDLGYNSIVCTAGYMYMYSVQFHNLQSYHK